MESQLAKDREIDCNFLKLENEYIPGYIKSILKGEPVLAKFFHDISEYRKLKDLFGRVSHEHIVQLRGYCDNVFHPALFIQEAKHQTLR